MGQNLSDGVDRERRMPDWLMHGAALVALAGATALTFLIWFLYRQCFLTGAELSRGSPSAKRPRAAGKPDSPQWLPHVPSLRVRTAIGSFGISSAQTRTP